ncbi:hypothetical protein TR75_06160 [Hydrogenibacillus schlegelii]|nr:hypothetical protein TR75_06160 [Hydrogenibacillus schlegelii]
MFSLQEGFRMNAVFPGAFDERFFAFDPFQSRFELDGAGDGFCAFHTSPLHWQKDTTIASAFVRSEGRMI